MKKLPNSILLLAVVFCIAILTTGCPVGVDYPLSENDQLEKVDNKLLGTWRSLSDTAEILEVRISEEDEITYGVVVLEQGENYMVDDSEFFSWTTRIDGHTFIFSQAATAGNNSYYLYEYAFEGKKLVIHDVGLLVGGMDAITSTETFRQEVSASLKLPECLSARIEYVRK